MKTIVQSPSPTIKCYHSFMDGKPLYQVFSASSNYVSGRNLQSYQFTRSVSQLTGTFNFTVKEESNNQELNDLFLDRVKLFDVITIQEKPNPQDRDIVFYGVITNITFSANAGGLQKLISVQGMSIEYLLEMLTISADVTAMAFAGKYWNTDIANLSLKLTQNKSNVEVKEALESIYNSFEESVKKISQLSNFKIAELIRFWYSNKEQEEFNLFDFDSENLHFYFPISSNMYDNNTISYINYIKNLLPANVYEIYGVVKDGKPKIKVRLVPFSPEKWNKLKPVKIDSSSLIDYSFQKSGEEVYTAFLPYVQGSSLDPDFLSRAMGTIQGNPNANVLENKLSIYGYKPLQCNFIGYPPNYIKEDVEVKGVESNQKITLQDCAKKLSEDMSKWYGNLDEMLDASIGIVNIFEKENAVIGEKVILLNGEFYITQENHSWNYGDAAKINYTCERGGKYIDGEFSELTGISKALGELEI